MFVLNVIGKGADPKLFSGLGSGDAQILSPDHAFDLPVAGIAALIAARDIAADLPLDINLVKTDQRRKQLLIADMDSTIINVECLDELADMAGLKPQIAAITERAMRGELEFEGALKERVADFYVRLINGKNKLKNLCLSSIRYCGICFSRFIRL